MTRRQRIQRLSRHRDELRMAYVQTHNPAIKKALGMIGHELQQLHGPQKPRTIKVAAMREP